MTDAGVRSITSQNLQAYKKLCGKKNLGSVVFATATPGSLTPQAFARREQEHHSEVYRKDFKEQGATFFQLFHTHASAKGLVAKVLERIKEEQRALLIQEELVEIRKLVPTATKAGRELKNALDEIMTHQKEVLAGEMISGEEAAVAAKIAMVSEQLRSLNIALSPRSSTFFGLVSRFFVLSWLALTDHEPALGIISRLSGDGHGLQTYLERSPFYILFLRVHTSRCPELASLPST